MRLPPGPEDLDEEGGARWELPGDQGVDGALLDFAPRDLKDLAEDGGGPKALPGGQELDQVVWQEGWFLSGGHAGTVFMLDEGSVERSFGEFICSLFDYSVSTIL